MKLPRQFHKRNLGNFISVICRDPMEREYLLVTYKHYEITQKVLVGPTCQWFSNHNLTIILGDFSLHTMVDN